MGTYTHEQIDQSVKIGHLVTARELADSAIDEAVQAARDLGMSWAMVAIGLGVSTQAAWERYGLSPHEKAERSRLSQSPVIQGQMILEAERMPVPVKTRRHRKGWTPA